MGILDWFKNRPAQFDPERISEDLILRTIAKAITLTNPRLRALPSCHSRLLPAVEHTIEFLRELIKTLPQARSISAAAWSGDTALRAFFVAPSDIPAVLGRSENLRVLFDKFPEVDEAFLVLGMAFEEQQVFGIAVNGGIVRRDVAQTSVCFSDHRTRPCSRDEHRLRRAIGAEAFEHLVGCALAAISEERDERQELEANASLLRARLRLLQQQGPGLGSLFGDLPAARGEQARLEAELLDNERQLEAIGGNQSALEMELDCLTEVLSNPERHLRIERRKLRLNTMNVVVDDPASDAAAGEVDFHIAELTSTSITRRAFVLARVARSELPAPRGLNLEALARYL